jgi:cyclophilin family peptidyl-prolyl cis-trans isomerase
MLLNQIKRGMFAAASLGVMLSTAGIVAAQDAQSPADLCANASISEPTTREFAAAETVLQPNTDYRAIFCTSAGAIYVDLFETLAPITVNNFVFLAEQGYFNNTTFHRVIEGFMAQGGDPSGTGSGGPGYQFQDEFVNFLTFEQSGLLAMANAGAGTNGSQFFITTAPTPHLNFAHTIFGEVRDGQDNVVNIELRDPAIATTPGTTLDTVLIVTDPASVISEFVAPAVATEADFETAIGEIGGSLTEQITLSESSGVFDADFVISAAPEAVRETLTAAFEEHGFAFRALAQVDNTACALDELGYGFLGYTADAFASATDANAMLNDGVYAEWLTSAGFTQVDSPADYAIFQRTITFCEAELTQYVGLWTRGRLVTQSTISVDPTIEGIPSAQEIIDSFVAPAFESTFADLLRPEIYVTE